MIFLFPIIFCFLIYPSSSVIRKFSQINFDRWIDDKNFLVVLFCNHDEDNICIKEREKLKEISDEMIEIQDMVFGYISKESDSILFARYNIDKIPMVKLYPYNEEVRNYPMNIRHKDLKEMILHTQKAILEKRTNPEKTYGRIPKQVVIPEIDWMDLPTTVKDPEKHAVMILYDDDCETSCQILNSVAKVFENENQVAFYRMHFDKSGSLRKTIPFDRSPSVFWYPQNDKERGFVYAGDIRFEVLVEFINDRAGLSRDYNGELKRDAGRILEIDKIIREHIMSILLKTNINYVIFLVEQKGKELPHAKKYIDYYIAILKEIRKGFDPDQILQREQKYINEMISKKTLGNSDKDEWRKFYNIVSAFIDFAASRLHEGINQHKAVLKEDITHESGGKYSSHDEL